MNFNCNKNIYPSQRNVIIAKNGMVATTQPLAAQAGLEMLKKGGNAVDAAIATAASLTVVEPTSNGIGGDAFAIVWFNEDLYGLNSSGPASCSITAEKVRERGYNSIPKYGWLPVNVPGVVMAWRELNNRFGNLSLEEVLSPSIEYAYEGYPVSPTVAKEWNNNFKIYEKFLKGEEFKYWFETFAPLGRAPYPGEIWRNKYMSNTLSQIAKSNGEDFYKGDIADKIVQFSKKYGGFLNKKDLENYESEWVEPLKVNYRGFDIWELPPNTHGLVVLMALNILKEFELKNRESIDTFHKQIEAMKMAYVDGEKYITDIKDMSVEIEALLSDAYAKKRAKLIEDHAKTYSYGVPNLGGTVYIATADSMGNMVSYIQSNYMGFGSGLVVPETGISLHNRGYTFSLDPSHNNFLKPGKKTYHTLIPGFITKDDKAIGSFGVMGAYMQPQGHLQVISNLIDFGLNPQDALDAFRWQWIKDNLVYIEEKFPRNLYYDLAKMGHNLKYSQDVSSFGRGQIIIRNKENVLFGGTESRADGFISPW